jgi:hypothetical protein
MQLAPETIDSRRRYLCRHIFTGGHRCASPALRGHQFCYNHHAARPAVPLSGRTGLFSMPRIDDRAAVQIALYEVLSRITAGDLDLNRARAILYGLQIASANLSRDPSQPSGLTAAVPHVDEIIHDIQLGDLAPIVELPSDDPSLPSPPEAPDIPQAGSSGPAGSTLARLAGPAGSSVVPTCSAEDPCMDGPEPLSLRDSVAVPSSCFADAPQIIPPERARSAAAIDSAVHTALRHSVSIDPAQPESLSALPASTPSP